MLPKAGGRRRSVALLTSMHGSMKPLMPHGFASNLSVELEQNYPSPRRVSGMVIVLLVLYSLRLVIATMGVVWSHREF